MKEINKFKKYFGYCLISFSNNIINYEKNYAEKRNNLYVEINVIPFNENRIKNSKEIVNKYHIENKQQNNDDNQNNKSSFPTGIIIVLIIFFILIVLFLLFRFYRKRNIAKMDDYFKNDFPNSN